MKNKNVDTHKHGEFLAGARTGLTQFPTFFTAFLFNFAAVAVLVVVAFFSDRFYQVTIESVNIKKTLLYLIKAKQISKKYVLFITIK